MRNRRFSAGTRATTRLAVVAALLASVLTSCGAFDPRTRGVGYEPRLDLAGQHRFGLFIGIDEYPRLQNGDLDGCVNDVRHLRDIFQQRFGFEPVATLIDQGATRAGIGEGFRRLIDAARSAGERDDAPVSVVICYAGHGSRVADQRTPEEGKDEGDDGLDETWLAHDSSWLGENDVRDDEVEAAIGELVRLGAQVLLISDSCHSGTLHRGASFAKRRTPRRPAGATTLRAGPANDLFPDLAPAPVTRGRAGEPLSGFVSYTACLDSQEASEYLDDEGRPCGRFTFVLRRLLPRIDPETSYQELYERIVAEFDRQWDDGFQLPQFHASVSKAGERFLGGGFAPAFGTVVEQRGTTVVVDQGILHGVDVGAVFDLHPDAETIRGGAEPVVRGTVVSVELSSAELELDRRIDVADHRARLDAVRVADLRVHADAGLPATLRQRLDALAEAEQIRLVGPDEPYELAVFADGSNTIRLHPPTSLPDPSGVAPGEPRRVITVDDRARAADALADHLLYLGRMRRLLSLERNEGDVVARIAVEEASPDGATVVERPTVNGVLRVQERDRLTIRLANEGGHGVFVTLLAVDDVGDPERGVPPGGLVRIYPATGEEPKRLEPGAERHIARFEATAASDLERTRIKLLATSRPVDFDPLLAPPEVGRHAVEAVTRGRAADGNGELMSILSGGPHAATRGRADRSSADYWATGLVVFDVAKH